MSPLATIHTHYHSTASQPQPLVRHRPPSPVTSSLPARLSTTRLRLTRQRNKNMMAAISDNGEVCLEIIKNKQGQHHEMVNLEMEAEWLRPI